MPRTVAVVGAGAAGLVAARQLLREGLHVAVFEKSGRAGGTWAYDPRADADPLSRDPGAPGAVHGSLYASLRTNLTRDLMSFSDFPMAGRVFAGDARAFPGHQEVLAFLDAFAEESGVAARVRLRSEVLRVALLVQGERWAVSWRREDGEVEQEAFDAVVVCNGHCTVPRVPNIQGIDNWSGKQIHSHNYRTPEPFRDQNVVVVGFSTSGIDIALEISHLAKEVHVADRYSKDRLGKMALYQNVWIHAEVDCIQDDGKVRFAEGSVVAADVILYCTGYRYHFPFLDLDGLTVDDNRVGPLYKHVFPPKYAPNLSFVGLPVKVQQHFFNEIHTMAKAKSFCTATGCIVQTSGKHDISKQSIWSIITANPKLCACLAFPDHRLPGTGAGSQVGGGRAVGAGHAAKRGGHDGVREEPLPADGGGREAEAPHARTGSSVGGAHELAQGPGRRASRGAVEVRDVR